MLLPFTDALVATNQFDPEMAALADRHYSRRTPGGRQFLYSGRKLVIRDAAGLVLFGWLYPDPAYRVDGQTGYYCAIFRNESRRRSSSIIIECERMAMEKWGPNRAFTFIDPRKIKSPNPGYCFKVAGWHFEDLTKTGKHILVKQLG